MPRYANVDRLMEHAISLDWSILKWVNEVDICTAINPNVVERKKGKWIRKSPTAWMWTCSCCKKDDAYAYSAGESCEPDVLQDLFCPNCGADMRERSDDDND